MKDKARRKFLKQSIGLGSSGYRAACAADVGRSVFASA